MGFADLGVAAAYLLSVGSALLCVVYGLLRWNQDDAMPDPVHPAGEDLSFEEEV